MSRWLPRLTSFVLLPIALLALPGLYAGFLEHGHELWRTPQFWPAVLGALPGVLAGRWVSRHATWWCTFEHELTHAVVGLPFLLIPYRFIVTPNRGGLVKVFTPPLPLFLVPIPLVGAHIMGLAPYSIPLFALVACVGGDLAGAWAHPVAFAAGVGFLGGYHLYTNLHELRGNASPRLFPDVEGNATHGDIAQSGYLLSAAMIPAMSLASYTVLMILLSRSGFVVLLGWAMSVGKAAIALVSAVPLRG